MKLSGVFAALSFVCLAAYTNAQSGSTCLLSTGNACLLTCGKIADQQYDRGNPAEYGSYAEVSLNADCTPCSGEECGFQCFAVGWGINVEGNNSACQGELAILADKTSLDALKRASNGHSILIADCGDGLHPLDERTTDAERMWSPDFRKRRLSDLIQVEGGGR
jgi:hypothetical protein